MKQYPENFAFLILRIFELFAREIFNMLYIVSEYL